MLKCDQTFIDEWSHRWEWHPDSSNHRWEWHPDLFESAEVKKAASTVMKPDEDSALNDRSSGIDKNQETDTGQNDKRKKLYKVLKSTYIRRLERQEKCVLQTSVDHRYFYPTDTGQKDIRKNTI